MLQNRDQFLQDSYLQEEFDFKDRKDDAILKTTRTVVYIPVMMDNMCIFK